MPKRPSKPLRRKDVITNLSHWQELDLLDVLDIMNIPGAPKQREIFNTEEDRIRIWKRYGESLIPKYIEMTGGAARPSLWWRYSKPEPKKLLGYTSYYSVFGKHQLVIKPQLESDSMFLLRVRCFYPQESMQLERQAGADSERIEKALRAHQRLLKTEKREVIEEAEKRAGVVSSRLLIIK